MGFEGVELFGPERLHLVEPRLQGHEMIGAQPVHAKAGIVVSLILL